MAALPTGGVALSVFVPPVPASRPRVTRWGTYYGKTYKNYMTDSEKAIPRAACPLEGNLQADVEFVCERPKTTKRLNPRGDIDNHLKSIFDAVTKAGYWHDDDQVVSVRAFKRFVATGEVPHTRIIIGSV